MGVLSGEFDLLNEPFEDSILEIESLAVQKIIDIQGLQQVWHVWNEGASEKLVLLHGGSGSWTHWIHNIKALSQHREVWALDIPGFGDSELPPNAVDVDDLVPFVIQGLIKVVQQQAVDVVGFSFGGLLAGYIAAKNASLIKKLILVGVPALGLTGKPLPLRGIRPEMVEDEITEIYRHNLEVMMISNKQKIDTQTLELQKKNIARDRLKRRRIARGDILLELQNDWKCPVYAVWGELDALYKEKIHLVKDKFANCNLRDFKVIPDAGHWVQYEQANEFNIHLLNILDQ